MKNITPGNVENRGFTLIELLVTIAIIALLTAILFPVFARAREQARKASCQSNLKQLGLAVAMYLQDYDETYPFQNLGYHNADGTTAHWYDGLQPYTRSYQVWICPTSGPVTKYSSGREYSYGVNLCGTSPNADYSIGQGFGDSITEPCTPTGAALKLSAVGNPSQVIYAGDPASNGIAGSSYGGLLVGYSNDTYIPVLHGGQVGPFTGSVQSPVDESMGGGNYLFADGHVKYIQVQKLIPLANRKPYFNITQ